MMSAQRRIGLMSKALALPCRRYGGASREPLPEGADRLQDGDFHKTAERYRSSKMNRMISIGSRKRTVF